MRWIANLILGNGCARNAETWFGNVESREVEGMAENVALLVGEKFG
jgi:hypothetical protein